MGIAKFFSMSTQRLVFLDFERALLFDGKENRVIERWKTVDRADLESVLGT